MFHLLKLREAGSKHAKNQQRQSELKHAAKPKTDTPDSEEKSSSDKSTK